jgi:phosphohistidine phosphatase
MKTLLLLRHAKSGWDEAVKRDFDRPINDRGRRAARRMGEEMRALGLHCSKIIASPALRVRETIGCTGDGLGHLLDAEYDTRAYLASPAVLLDLIHEADDVQDCLMIVGHNPGLESLALMLTVEDGSVGREALSVKYPTATLAQISLPVARWRDVAGGAGALERFVRPRDLDPSLGPDC